MEAELINEKELAELLRLKPATMRDWRVRKMGPPYIKLPNGSVRYAAKDVEQWIHKLAS